VRRKKARSFRVQAGMGEDCVAGMILRNKRETNKVPGKYEAEEGARIVLSMQQT
jgi:hypothetical protein